MDIKELNELTQKLIRIWKSGKQETELTQDEKYTLVLRDQIWWDRLTPSDQLDAMKRRYKWLQRLERISE